MKKRISIGFNLFLLVLFCIQSYAQMNEYSYKREILEIKEQWHSVLLPDAVFGKVKYNFSDIRVFGITKQKDTIEAPYLLKLLREKISSKAIQFKILNTSFNQKGFYITMEIPTKETINRIDLDFDQSNFDWLLILQGSQDQKEWFTVIEDYRILSITNDLTNYKFTTINFPNAQYRYFRLFIKTKDKPVLKTAEVTLRELVEAGYNEYPIRKLNVKGDKQNKQTILYINLNMPVPVSYLKIKTSEDFDYYRPITIQYLTDSVKTTEGWKYRYQTLKSGILSSIEENEFKLSSTIAEKLRVIINNHDNEPLTIDKVSVKGYQHKLITRFSKPAKYYLTYGNSKASKPNYDINYLPSKMPDSLTNLIVGEEQRIDKKEEPVKEPLFTNKTWLWAVMFIIIALLGWFTLMMIKKK